MKGQSPSYYTKLEPEGEEPPVVARYDTIVFLFYCDHHRKICVTCPERINASWLPFIRAGYNKSWNEEAYEGAMLTLSNKSKTLFDSFHEQPPFDLPLECLQILRYQLPHTLEFVQRISYMVTINRNNSHYKCCHDTERLIWIPLESAVKGDVKELWGPEVVSFADTIIHKSHQNLFEYALDEALWFVPRDPPRNIEETMLKSINITEKDVERLFEDYVDHCFPSFYMSLNSFKCYMDKYGFETNDNKLILLFRSFNYMRTGFICFHELLLGLVIIEPETSHGLARARFIFRYYDQDASGFLSMEEFGRLIKDIHYKIKNHDELESKVVQLKKVIGTKMQDGKEVITGEDFLKAIGDKRFRGTSQLCRSTKSIFTNILRTIAARCVYTVGTLVDLGSIIRHTTAPCLSCRSKDYEIATHAPLVLKDGRVTDPLCVIDVEDDVEKLTSSVYSVDFVFNRNSAANVIIRLVHAFNQIKGTNKDPNGLLQDKPLVLWDIILALYHDVDLLLMEEDKCPRINAPCYIIGDIHGNLEDLLSIEKSIFQRSPCVAANYLFLGDYVDRGQWSVECALLLFAFKCVAPNKVTLLRGNHEVRDLQCNYTYRTECLRKYGQDIGMKIWELTNTIFDKLPVAAVVDDSIFCAHGGIPKSCKFVHEISEIPHILRDPESSSCIAWEILWSDPCHPRQFFEVANVTQQDARENFIYNSKRGTAYLFNEKAAKEFLRYNKLTHIIRGHEVPQRGYQFHFGQVCCTVFSCSHYCGNNNECAVILVDNNTIRLIRLDTVANEPATD